MWAMIVCTSFFLSGSKDSFPARMMQHLTMTTTITHNIQWTKPFVQTGAIYSTLHKVTNNRASQNTKYIKQPEEIFNSLGFQRHWHK